jgi:hypothetical protein
MRWHDPGAGSAANGELKTFPRAGRNGVLAKGIRAMSLVATAFENLPIVAEANADESVLVF